MKYAELTKRHPEYNEKLMKELNLLYTGGHQLYDNAIDFLVQIIGENKYRYESRLKIPCYVNYFAQIVGCYVNGLFSQDLHISPSDEEADIDEDFWSDFDVDCNLEKDSFKNILRERVAQALVQKRTFVAIDFPAFEEAETKAQEDALGNSRAYIVPIDIQRVINWKEQPGLTRTYALNEDNKKVVRFEAKKLQYVVLYHCYLDDDGIKTEEFKVWRKESNDLNNPIVSWQLYRIRWEKNVAPQMDQEFSPVSEGIATQCSEIPLIELKVPDDLWLGGKIGNLCKLIWQRKSELFAAEDKTLISIPVVYLGPEIPEVDGAIAENQTNPHRGHDPREQFDKKGFMVLGHQDEMEFVSPDASPYQYINDEINEMINEMFRICYLSGYSPVSDTNNKDKSGKAKQEDRHAFNQMLISLGDIVKNFSLKIYNFIAKARNEQVVFKATGMDNFDVYDPTILIDALLGINSLGVYSKKWKTEYKLDLMNKLLPNLPPEVINEIHDEEYAAINKMADPVSVIKAASQPNTENKE